MSDFAGKVAPITGRSFVNGAYMQWMGASWPGNRVNAFSSSGLA